MIKGIKLKPETVKRLEAEMILERIENQKSLYSRLIIAAFENRHNPTGRDYLESAKKYRPAKSQVEN